MPAPEREKLVKKSLKTFLLLFLCLGALLGGMVLVFYQTQTENYNDRLCEEEQHSVNLQREVLRNHLTSIFSDLLFLAGQEELKAYLDDDSSTNLNLINSEYLTFSASKKIYDQVRYLDSDGLEVARVNFNNGQLASVPKGKLQSKQNRYYFMDALKLNKGEVFVSPLDLNIERGKVEEPYKPMIRFGTPVYDRTGIKRGVVLLNYMGSNLISLIQDVGSVARGQTMLLNADGYWLEHPEADKAWGFMFEDKSHLSLAKQHPEVWNQMLARDSDHLHIPQGTYVYTTIYMHDFSSEITVNYDDYFWKIVSFVPADNLSSYVKDLKNSLFVLGAGLLLLIAVVSWYFSLAITRRKLYQAQLVSMAHYDALTGLPNRTLLFERLNQSLQQAKRYDRMCALLYVDLDGFKQINDTLGHDAGDELLVETGERMEICCRASDTVARLGGDEFAILLTEVLGVEGAQIFAEKVLAAFNEPFSLKQGEARVGVSIGIGMFPTHGTTLDQLMKSADKAMYLSKNRGKNTYTMADKKDD